MNDRPAGGRAYRRLLGSAAWRRFTLTAGFQRLSVAMAPLALVLAGHGALGSFRVGALMASAYTLADGIASPWSGRLMDRVELRRGLSAELGAAAVVLAGLAGLAAERAPALALIVLSGLAGAAPAGVMGGLRAYLQHITPGDLRERAFALDATLLELEWMFAPALVAITGFLGAPALAIVLMAVAALGAFGGARLLSPRPPSGHTASASGAWRNPKAIPVYFLSAVMGYTEGTINIALAPLMTAVGSRPATAGLLIALLSLASAAGGFAYTASSGHLPGDTDQRANITLLALGLCASLIALAPSLITVALAVAACGIWFAPLNAMRTLILGQLLPAGQLSEGFSTYPRRCRWATGRAASPQAPSSESGGPAPASSSRPRSRPPALPGPGCCTSTAKTPRSPGMPNRQNLTGNPAPATHPSRTRHAGAGMTSICPVTATTAATNRARARAHTRRFVLLRG